jgi:diketogulonate reductase-like aldo/keto reductase
MPGRGVIIERTRTIQGVRVPTFLYGTAWKEDATTELVSLALAAGFRGIDTANQRRHYHEAAVGVALAQALGEGELQPDDLFLQTKFTYVAGQDHRLPYDPRAPVSEQVEQSFLRSLDHLGVERLDSYVLHGPSRRRGLGPDDYEAWRAMESLHEAGGTRLLGVSNVLADQLEELVRFARVPPAFVQNRCFAQLGWDAQVREVCERLAVAYQAFSLLTANAHVLRHPAVRRIAAAHGRTAPQVIFRFALALGMIPLTGTTDPVHMKEDLEVYDFALTADEVRIIGAVGLDPR